MKAFGVGACVYAATIFLALGAGANAEDGKVDSAFAQQFQAKAAYCKTCHGVSGQGFRGAFPMPRLAGQQPEYIEAKITAFVEHRRNNPVMNNVTRGISPAMLTALAKHFQSLNPEPLGGAPKAIMPLGKKIFIEGVPDKDVPPCASCHGEDARGNGIFPRLAGQLNDYIIRKLSNWDRERGQDPKNPDNSAMMEPVTHNLTHEQLVAVAAYVSSLR